MEAVVDYKLSDLDTQIDKLTTLSDTLGARNEMLRLKYGSGIMLPNFDLAAAVRSLKKKVSKFLGNTSKYSPHQGKQEIARRLSRMTKVAV